MREWLIRAGLVTGVPILLLAAIELTARAAGVGYDPSFWITVPAKRAMATNDDFGRRFFPRGLVRTPAAQIATQVKSSKTRRVFLLGESAAMGFPEPALGLAPMLELLLREAQPEVAWEVYNTAMTAINSHVILTIARDCAQLSPDVFIVLAGNNEAVGPFGPATVFGQSGLALPLIRASTYIGGTRLGQFFSGAIQPRQPAEWRGMEMFTEQRIAASDPRLSRMYDSWRENLSDIVATGKKAGAQLVLVTVPVNLKDQPPFASAASGAAAAFERGRNLLASRQTDAAALELRLARDQDLLRFRADSTINNIIRHVAKRDNARLVDAEQEFGVAGDEFFWEHVHFTPLGTHRLAEQIAHALGVSNPLPFEQLRQSLPLTEFDEHKVRVQIAALLRRPPFSGQPGVTERMARLNHPAITAEQRTEAQSLFEAALRRRPHDLPLLSRYASMLRDAGRAKESADVYARMLELLPDRKGWLVARGAALSDAGLQDQAIAAFQAALAIDPDLDPAWFGTALAHARSGRHEEAVKLYSKALALNPRYGDAAYNLAGSLAALGRTADARQQLERAVELQPELSVAHAALGQLHARDGRLDEAIAQYREATRDGTPLPDAHYDLGILLARKGQLSEAIAEYRRALELRPGYPEALNNLGIALARQGDRSGATDAFTRALELRPTFEAARTNLDRMRRQVAVRR